MKKIISLLVVVALIAAGLVISAFAADTALIAVEKTEAKRGDEVTLEVIIDNNPGFGALDFTFEYDKAALTLTKIEAGEVLQGAMMVPNVSDGKVSVMTLADITTNGVMLKLTFTVNEAAVDGNNAVTVNVTNMANGSGTQIERTVDAGGITVAHVCDPVDVPEVPAKCEENGTEAHQKCSCGKLYQNGVEVTEADLVIEKLNHKNAESEWDFEPYTDGNYDIVTYCPDCETELERIKPGVAENPFLVTFVMGDDGLSMTATVEVPAGEFYCRGGMMIAGKTLTVTDTAGNVISTETLQPPRMPGDPVVFVLTNEGNGAVKYNLTVTTPLGAMDNPAELVIGDNEFAVEAGNDQGYYLTWTAPAAGYLRLFATVSPDGVVYAMNATNFMTYKQYTLDEDAVDGVLLLPVAEGDEIMINVAALEDAQGNRYPAAEFAVTALFTGDSEENPEWIYNVEFDDEYTVGTYTMEVPVGTVHIATYNVGGMILTVTDAEGNVVNQQLLPSAVGRTPVGFTLTNEGEATATYTLTFTYPVGSFMNPDELVEGDNSAEFEKDAQEPYYFEWVAPEDGTVTVIVTADGGWVFAVGNITTSVYSEEYCSADDPVVNTVTMEVKKGDVIMVAVVSVDPQDPNTIVAGTVNVNFEFTSAPAKTGDPITMVLAAALISGMSVVALTKKKEN